ncbi:MAG: PAS domain-containing protein, partial [Candidatus Binatia bacterium]
MALALLMPPGVYSIVAHSTLVASMQSQAELDAAAINNEIINKSPQLWMFQEVRLKEMMSHRLSDEALANEFLRIIDNNQKVVAAVGNPLPWPVIALSQPLFDAGRQVGRLEVQRSLRPLLVNAAWLSLFGLMLAVGSFVSLRVLPLRAVLGANDSLRRRTEELLREIEERQRTQAELQESEQVIEAVLNSVPARIFWKDKNLVYLGCNAAFARDAGFTRPEDVVGKDDYQMGWRDQANLYRGDDRKVIESGLPKLLIDEPQTTPEGKVITLLTSKIPLRGSNGEIAGVLGMYMDVTERARLQQQLAYSNLLNTAALENAPDGILVVDQNGMIVSFNGPFTKMWNIPQELVSNRNDEPMLQAVASQVADEKEFIARVKYLYEHPDDKGHEELKLKDGRVFERHSGSLRDASQKYLGRIW